jgi:hypothetical protein
MVERIDPEPRSWSRTTSARSLRPARDRPAQHGRRLRRPLRPGRRAQLRAGRQAHAAVQGSTTTSSPSATPPTSPPPRPARSRTSRSRSSSTTSSSTSQRQADDRLVRRPRQLLHRVRRRQGLLIDFNYDTEPLPGKYPLPVRRPVQPAQGEPRQPPGASSRSAGIYWNVLLPGRPIPLPAHMSMAGKTHCQHQPHATEERLHARHDLNGHEIHVNDEGFLTDPYDEWDEELAQGARAQIGITDRRALEGDPVPARGLQGRQGETATLRRVSDRRAAFPSRSCSCCSPRSRPRRWPTSPACPSPHGCV